MSDENDPTLIREKICTIRFPSRFKDYDLDDFFLWYFLSKSFLNRINSTVIHGCEFLESFNDYAFDLLFVLGENLAVH